MKQKQANISEARSARRSTEEAALQAEETTKQAEEAAKQAVQATKLAEQSTRLAEETTKQGYTLMLVKWPRLQTPCQTIVAYAFTVHHCHHNLRKLVASPGKD